MQTQSAPLCCEYTAATAESEHKALRSCEFCLAHVALKGNARSRRAELQRDVELADREADASSQSPGVGMQSHEIVVPTLKSDIIKTS